MYLGIHTSPSGGAENTVKNGEKYDVNTIQTIPLEGNFTWINRIRDIHILAFINQITDSTIKKVLISNALLSSFKKGNELLFAPDEQILKNLLDFVNRTAKLIEEREINVEILGVVLHPSSQGDLSYDESLTNISAMIQRILTEIGGTQKILIETTAGYAKGIGSTFEDLKNIRDGVKDKERVGFVVDTQHTFASGYDWVNNFEGVIKDLENILGIENIKAIHLNDSNTELGSKKDIHACLGEGYIGEETLRKILKYEKFKNIPFILESPALLDESSTFDEVNKLKDWAGEI